jgi:NADPH:quinone reductase-like Zn-dependent oxidoreductase
MRTWIIPTPGSIDNLRLASRPDPTPGPGQVLVRVKATSLNYRDLITVEGKYARSAPKPDLVPLSDGAGEVVSVGAGVTRWKAGDRVAGCFMQRWSGGEADAEAFATAMGGAIDGMLTELAVLEEGGAVRVPGHMSYEEAATLPCAALTAWHALVEIGGIKAGDTVVVQGSGGVSIFALQLARLMGARVIATSGSAAKAERLKAMGATAVIVVEVGGPGTLPRSFQAARVGGRIPVIGLLSGVGGEVDPMPILRRNLRVQGVYVGSRQMFEAMNRAMDEAKLKPVVDRVFAFDEAKAAYAHMKAQGHFGKIVIRHD